MFDGLNMSLGNLERPIRSANTFGFPGELRRGEGQGRHGHRLLPNPLRYERALPGPIPGSFTLPAVAAGHREIPAQTSTAASRLVRFVGPGPAPGSSRPTEPRTMSLGSTHRVSKPGPALSRMMFRSSLAACLPNSVGTMSTVVSAGASSSPKSMPSKPTTLRSRGIASESSWAAR